MHCTCNQIDLNQTAKLLMAKDNIYILCHQSPDGDTLGSAMALYLALKKLNKKSKILCNDVIPQKYDYIFGSLEIDDFSPEYIVAVDVADIGLLGKELSKIIKKVDLCIDHHGSNTKYAQNLFLNPHAAATTEIIYNLLVSMNINIDNQIAECIYTGLSTDTGCFKYTNVTPKTHRVAAYMIEAGARAAMINKIMFDTKTKEKLKLEQMVLNNIEFYFDYRCAVICVTNEMINVSKATESDMDGISSLPRQIEGVMIGVTIREKNDNEFKISVRTGPEIDASKICANFEGGGHPAAAGCLIKDDLSTVKQKLLAVIENYIKLL